MRRYSGRLRLQNIMNEVLILSVGEDIECTDILIKEVVEVHMSAFPNFFLSSLGSSFLKTYYHYLAQHQRGNLIVAMEDSRVVAFAAAATESKGFNTSLLKKNLFAFGCRSIILLFTKPRTIVHLAKNMSKTSVDVDDDENYAELFSIGTSSVIQGKGVGSKLIKQLETQLKNKGVNKISLTTDVLDNEATLAFYKKNGYGVLYEFVAYPNRKMYRLIKRL